MHYSIQCLFYHPTHAAMMNKCLDFCDYFLQGVVEYLQLIIQNPIFLERVEGVGFISQELDVYIYVDACLTTYIVSLHAKCVSLDVRTRVDMLKLIVFELIHRELISLLR
ncbi:hypothetical protein ACJX0J_016738 [Zea mays]